MDRDGEIKKIRRRIGEKSKKRSGVMIYLCMDCGIIEYLDHIVPGGKKCPGGCGYIMDNEEPE
jgi:hypothetical protein